MLKIIGWSILIIFIIGLLVVVGFFKLIFYSPFAASGSHCLNFKLCVESSPQS